MLVELHDPSLAIGYAAGTLTGIIFGYIVGHHYKNNYRKDIEAAKQCILKNNDELLKLAIESQACGHAELEETLKKEMRRILRNQQNDTSPQSAD